MATYSPSAPVSGFGGGGDVPIPPDGGGGGDSSGPNHPDYRARLRRARLGLVCGIATVCAVFVSLTAVYLVRRGSPGINAATLADGGWGNVSLPWGVLGFNTALLLISSATIDMARRDIIQKTALAPLKSIPGISIEDRRGSFWLGLTVLLGVAFLTGQRMAWGELKRRGFFIDTNPSASFIYILTAAHALHLCGGVAALGWASLTSLLHRPVETRRIWIDITAWYWHFMAVLWIYVFALLGIAR